MISKESEVTELAVLCCSFSIICAWLSIASGEWIIAIAGLPTLSVSIYSVLAIRLLRKMRLVESFGGGLAGEYRERIGYWGAHSLLECEVAQRRYEEFYSAWMKTLKGE